MSAVLLVAVWVVVLAGAAVLALRDIMGASEQRPAGRAWRASMPEPATAGLAAIALGALALRLLHPVALGSWPQALEELRLDGELPGLPSSIAALVAAVLLYSFDGVGTTVLVVGPVAGALACVLLGLAVTRVTADKAAGLGAAAALALSPNAMALSSTPGAGAFVPFVTAAALFGVLAPDARRRLAGTMAGLLLVTLAGPKAWTTALAVMALALAPSAPGPAARGEARLLAPLAVAALVAWGLLLLPEPDLPAVGRSPLEWVWLALAGAGLFALPATARLAFTAFAVLSWAGAFLAVPALPVTGPAPAPAAWLDVPIALFAGFGVSAVVAAGRRFSGRVPAFVRRRWRLAPAGAAAVLIVAAVGGFARVQGAWDRRELRGLFAAIDDLRARRGLRESTLLLTTPETEVAAQSLLPLVSDFARGRSARAAGADSLRDEPGCLVLRVESAGAAPPPAARLVRRYGPQVAVWQVAPDACRTLAPSPGASSDPGGRWIF